MKNVFGYRIDRFLPFIWDRIHPIPKPAEINAMDLPALKQAERKLSLELRQNHPATWWAEIQRRRGGMSEEDAARANAERLGIRIDAGATKEQIADIVKYEQDRSLERWKNHPHSQWNLGKSTPHWFTRTFTSAQQAEHASKVLRGILESGLRGNLKGVGMLLEELGPMVEDIGTVFPGMKSLLSVLNRATGNKPAETAPKGETGPSGLSRREFIGTTAGAAAAAPNLPQALAKTALDQIKAKLSEIAPGLPITIKEGVVVPYRYPGDPITEESGWSFIRKGEKVDPKDSFSRTGFSGMIPGAPRPAVDISAYSGRESGVNETFVGSAEELLKKKIGDWQTFREGEREPWEVSGLKGQLEEVYEDAVRNIQEYVVGIRQEARLKNLRGAWLQIVRRMEELKKNPEAKSAAPKTTPPPTRREMAERVAQAMKEPAQKPATQPTTAPPKAPEGMTRRFWESSSK